MKLESYITTMDAFLKKRLMTMNHGVQQDYLILWKEGNNTKKCAITLSISLENMYPIAH